MLEPKDESKTGAEQQADNEKYASFRDGHQHDHENADHDQKADGMTRPLTRAERAERCKVREC